MKQLILMLLIGAGIALYSCKSDEDKPIDLTCSGNCLFTADRAEGTIVLLTCFNRYGIRTIKPGTDSVVVYGIPDEMDAKFETEGKKVTFSGIFRENTLTPQFPDPDVDPGSLFQMELKAID